MLKNVSASSPIGEENQSSGEIWRNMADTATVKAAKEINKQRSGENSAHGEAILKASS